MPRPPRLEFADAVYHVMSRGNARKRIFYRSPATRRRIAQIESTILARAEK